MKVLVTGAGGQLGREAMLAFGAQGYDVTGIDRGELDLVAVERVAEAVAAHRADWVVHCAAYTQVDRAEEEPERAFAINRDAAGAVAQGAQRSGSRLLHVSTDFIFGGRQATPYREDAEGDALGVYGQSKWEGEQAVRAALPQALILRTAWVYGVHGHNFVKTMLRLATERDELRVVDDQIGTPTWTGDIVRAMQALMGKNAEGICHFTNEGVASWYDFAQAIIEQAKARAMPLKTTRVLPIPTADYPTPARRPAYSVLDKTRTRALLDYDIPHWRTSLATMLDQLENTPSLRGA